MARAGPSEEEGRRGHQRPALGNMPPCRRPSQATTRCSYPTTRTCLQEHWIFSIVKSFSFSPTVESYSICVTKTSYIPYILHVRNTEFIQNETYDEETMIMGNNIRIGSNVTSFREEGPVVVDSNKTVVSYSGEVLIKNDFEVKKGAELCIECNIQP